MSVDKRQKLYKCRTCGDTNPDCFVNLGVGIDTCDFSYNNKYCFYLQGSNGPVRLWSLMTAYKLNLTNDRNTLIDSKDIAGLIKLLNKEQEIADTINSERLNPLNQGLPYIVTAFFYRHGDEAYEFEYIDVPVSEYHVHE